MSSTAKYLCDGWWKLYFGGCYLFTIQSATMEKSDKERIEKEAEEYSGFRTTERYKKIKLHSYIAGATVWSERAQQELQAYRDIIKELLPLAENEIKMSTCIGYSYDKWKSTISKARKLIDTVTPI